MRGSIQLRVEYVGSVLLPYPWTEEGSIAALPRILQIFKRFTVDGVSLQQAAHGSNTASSQQKLEWPELIEKFREQRPAASDTTWRNHYLPALTKAGERMARAKDGADLLEAVLSEWTQGSRMRQISRRNLTAFLTWAVQRQHLKPYFAPPAHVPEILKAKRVGYPLTDAQILRLLDGIPDERWRFAVQLCAEHGLRPEELRWLRIKEGVNGPELWTIYRKSKGGRKGEKTEPRRLHSLPVADAGPWNLQQRIQAGDELPPLRTDGKGAQALTTYLNRREVWRSLKAEAEDAGETLTAYSFRHRYARESHRAGITVADIANAMGHSVEVHLQSYARFTPDATAAAYASVISVPVPERSRPD